MKTICFTVVNGVLTPDAVQAGQQYDNLSTEVKILLPQSLSAGTYEYVLKFRLQNGQEFTSAPLTQSDGYISFAIPKALTECPGALDLQLRVRNPSTGAIMHSAIGNPKLYIAPSIGTE